MSNLDDNELHLAVHCSDIDAAKKALADGINPNTIGLFGWNSLHEAASNGDLELLILLIQYGGECNKKDASSGYTPLHYASSEGHSDCLEYLISVGGDVKVKSNKGQTVAQVTRHKNCKKVLEKHGITVKTSVRFEKRQSTKNEKSGKNASNKKSIGASGISKSSDDFLSLPDHKPITLRNLSSSLTDEFSGKSYSSLQSLTSIGSSIDDTVAGYMTAAFQYNRKTARLTISISNIILTCLKLHERHKKESCLTLQIEGEISHTFDAKNKVIVTSQCFKLHTNGTEDIPAKDISNKLETYWSSEAAYLKFNPTINLDFTSVNGNNIADQNISIYILLQRKKSLLKSTGQHVTIASMQLPLHGAVKRILKERYELEHGAENSELAFSNPMLSEIIVGKESVVSDSVIIGMRRPSVIEASRCVSDSDLKTVMSAANKPSLKNSKLSHSTIIIPNFCASDLETVVSGANKPSSKNSTLPHSTIDIPTFSDCKFDLRDVKSHSPSPDAQVQIQLPSANSSDDELEVVVSQE